MAKCDKECYLTGQCLNHWSVLRGNREMTRSTNFRVRLLVGCHGLESDACRFRVRKCDGNLPGDPSCKLCGSVEESVLHFTAQCPALSRRREELLSTAPSSFLDFVASSDHDVFCDCLLGTDWVDNAEFQHYAVNFLTEVRSHRNNLSTEI